MVQTIYDIVAENPESTVVAEYQTDYKRETAYQSEADLIHNLRVQLQKLNNYTFSDKEWNNFFKTKIANQNSGIEEKTTIIKEDYIQLLTRDNGETKNIYLIDKQNIHNNSLQIVNQYTSPRPADTPLQNGEGCPQDGVRKSHSYEFTSWWADANNRPITDLQGFAKTFFAKHSILNLLTKYCVFTSDKMLLAMRPYQIVATERILGRINVSNNYKTYGKVEGGGYIWHTTGSGKTLTSFKTALLASKLPYIDKVLFVVDRKDLDYQTMKEYDKFEKGAANSNTSTAVLAKQLNDPNCKIIITTIQKLANYVKSTKSNELTKSVVQTLHFVIIFDECHRSQFGDMQTAIIKKFKKYNIFGFTGTPIFAQNSSPLRLRSGNGRSLSVVEMTTQQAFGDKLHTYTIVDAITDKNVLPFRIDYVSTMREQEDIKDEKVWNIDREKALAAPKRISNIVGYIREHFDQKTKRNSFYQLKERRLRGFNSIFCVLSIDVAKLYYEEFKKQQNQCNQKNPINHGSDNYLKIATIFFYGANDEMEDGLIDENSEDTSNFSVTHRDFLERAISDYNAILKTTFDTSSDKFQRVQKL